MTAIEGLVVGPAALTAAALLVRAARGGGPGALTVAVAMAIAGALAAVARGGWGAPGAPPVQSVRVAASGGYVGSAACKGCHPGAYATWHRTFHRTMTQVASPSTVRAPIDGRLALRRDGTRETVWAGDRRVEMTTGSHHYEAYWVAAERPGELRLLPFVFLLRERRWAPRRDVFLQPPDAPDREVHWGSNCIACHAVAGRPRLDAAGARFDTDVAELGVACEACHGAGDAHVRRHRDPVARYARRLARSSGPDRTIVQPARLGPDASSAVCGQCHAYAYPRDEDEWWTHGYTRTFRPGGDLGASRFLLAPSAMHGADADVASLFWPDGTIRVGGREYNGMVLSSCFARAPEARRVRCLDCHAMHGEDAVGQLSADGRGDGACLRCHEGIAARPADHTHHAPASPGSRCVACHMPKTSYALLGAVRSHRIDSPDATSSRTTGRPTACALCHVDRTAAWTASAIERWYGGRARSAAQESADTTSAAVALALEGDAAQRAIAADALGSSDARAAAGDDWQPPILAALLEDPYAAVRAIAARSLGSLEGYGDLAIDPSAPSIERAALRRAIVSRWSARARAARSPADAAAVLLTPEGAVDASGFAALLARRDDRGITISE